MSLKVGLIGETETDPTDKDTAVVVVPEVCYLDDMLEARTLGRFLAGITGREADERGKVLHHAEWTVTSDADEVVAMSKGDECAACQANCDQVRAWVAEHKRRDVAVGIMWWV